MSCELKPLGAASSRIGRSARVVTSVCLVFTVLGCSHEYERKPTVELTIANSSDDQQLFYIIVKGEASDEEALESSYFAKVLPDSEEVVGLGSARRGEDAHCFMSNERLLIVESPSGINPPSRDDDNIPVQHNLTQWVPDAKVWKSYPKGSCFDEPTQRIAWPELQPCAVKLVRGEISGERSR